MQTIAVNGAIIIWVSLLLFAPALAWAVHRPSSAVSLAGGAAVSLTLLSAVMCAVALFGDGCIVPLRVCAVLLGLVLAYSVVRAAIGLRQRLARLRSQPHLLALPLGLVVGIWVLGPPLQALSHAGVTFGYATTGNVDLMNYSLFAENMANSGFHNSHHLANIDLGYVTEHASYTGPSALINFVSAATGLPVWKSTFVCMGIAICLAVVALWALGSAVWPSAPYCVAAAAAIGCLAAFTVYNESQFFLGAELGLAGVATGLAGATALARGPSLPAFVTLAFGSAMGVYCYAPMGFPVLVLLPFWAVLVALLVDVRTWRGLLAVAVRAGVAVVIGLVLALPAATATWNLVRTQRTIVAGWSLPVVSATSALFWPSGIDDSSTHFALIASWATVAVVVLAALVLAWRRGLRAPVRLAGVLAVAIVVVIAGVVHSYGSTRYQTWKMESFLLPMALVITLPAIGAAAVGTVRSGRTLLTGIAGVLLLTPVLMWLPGINPHYPGVESSASLVRLSTSPALKDIASLNIRLPTYFESMSAGAILSRSIVSFTDNSYYANDTLLGTCTLTTRALLTPGETDYTPLGGDYVLLNRPSPCAKRSSTHQPVGRVVAANDGQFEGPVGAYVEAASTSGLERAPGVELWWLTSAKADVTVENLSQDSPAVQVTTTVLPTPCAGATAKVVFTLPGGQSIQLDVPVGGKSITFPLSVAKGHSKTVQVSVLSPQCRDPGDPRTFYAGLYNLSAKAATSG